MSKLHPGGNLQKYECKENFQQQDSSKRYSNGTAGKRETNRNTTNISRLGLSFRQVLTQPPVWRPSYGGGPYYVLVSYALSWRSLFKARNSLRSPLFPIPLPFLFSQKQKKPLSSANCSTLDPSHKQQHLKEAHQHRNHGSPSYCAAR